MTGVAQQSGEFGTFDGGVAEEGGESAGGEGRDILHGEVEQ